MSSNPQTLELIIKHGLTVRQIPNTVISLYSLRPNHTLKSNEVIIEKNGRSFIQETNVPANAGKWMAKKCVHTNSMIRWDVKTDNLADTLEEAVLKAVTN